MKLMAVAVRENVKSYAEKHLKFAEQNKNYEVIVVPVVHYTTENWKMNQSDKRKEFVVWMKSLRLMAGFILHSVKKYRNTE
jgi:L-fucose isomerase-like protein